MYIYSFRIFIFTLFYIQILSQTESDSHLELDFRKLDQ